MGWVKSWTKRIVPATISRRALYLGEPGILEELRVEQHPQHRRDVVVGLEVGVLQLRDGLRVPGRGPLPGRYLGLVGHEEVVQVARDEACGGWLPGDDVDNLAPVEIAGLAEKSLLSFVVVCGVVGKLGGVAAVWIPGDGIGDGPSR